MKYCSRCGQPVTPAGKPYHDTQSSVSIRKFTCPASHEWNVISDDYGGVERIEEFSKERPATLVKWD